MDKEFTYYINNISTLDDVLTLSKSVFSPTKEEILKYHDRTDWIKKIESGGLLLSVYDDKCIGFTICYKVDNQELHIWNVGVLDDYRGKGIWKEMYKRVIDYALSNEFTKLTLNTYKDKFPNMYSFVNKEGFELLKEETTPNGYIKSFFSKNIY